MINYYSYVLNLNDDSLKISVDYNIQLEDHKETYLIEPPPKLLEIISKSFDSYDFDFYKVYFKPIEIEKVTRITDYRGVWGLLSLPIGTLSGSCVSTTQKIYFGVDVTHNAMLSSKCSIVICCPKSKRVTLQDVFSLIKGLTAESFNSIDTLSQDIYQQDSNLYIVNWNVKDMIELSVYGNIKKVFSAGILSDLKTIIIK